MPASRKRFRTICGNRRPCLANTSAAWPLSRVADGELILNLPPESNRVTERGTYHFLRAASPALVLARIGNRDRQVISTLVATLLCTRRALGPVISRPFTGGSDMIQNAKFPPCGVVRRQLHLWFAPEFLGHFEAGDESHHLG